MTLVSACFTKKIGLYMCACKYMFTMYWKVQYKFKHSWKTRSLFVLIHIVWSAFLSPLSFEEGMVTIKTALVCEPKPFSFFCSGRESMWIIFHMTILTLSGKLNYKMKYTQTFFMYVHSLNVRRKIRAKCSVRTGNLKENCNQVTEMMGLCP